MKKKSTTQKVKDKKIIEKYLDLFAELEKLEKELANVKKRINNFSDKKQIHDVLEKISSISTN